MTSILPPAPKQAGTGRCRRGHVFARDARSRCRECDRLRRNADPERIKAVRDAHRAAKIEKYLMQGARRRARNSGCACTITEADIKIPTHCPLLGIKLLLSKTKHSAASPSLDKIVPTYGYVPGNVLVISHRANMLKGNATLKELQMLVSNLARFVL